MNVTADDNSDVGTGSTSGTEFSGQTNQPDTEVAVATKLNRPADMIHWPDAEEDIPGVKQFDASALTFFHRTGLHPGREEKSPQHPELYPAVLQPYLRTDRFRSPWPILFARKNDETVIRSLSEVIDLAIGELEGEELEIPTEREVGIPPRDKIMDMARSDPLATASMIRAWLRDKR